MREENRDGVIEILYIYIYIYTQKESQRNREWHRGGAKTEKVREKSKEWESERKIDRNSEK